MKGIVLVLILGIAAGEGFLFDLDLSLDSALQRGGTLSKNTGDYLYNSFRSS